MSVLQPGSRIGARYIVQGRLGSGGMATVYHCIDTQVGRAVAVKLLHHHLRVDNPEIVQRFTQEARIMMHLSQPAPHPNVVAVTEVIIEPELRAMVMELVTGSGGLDEFLVSHGPLSEADAVSLMTDILAGLQFVHEHQIIHRDLKPSNILLTRDANGLLQPKLSDFGIAKRLDTQDADLGMAGTLTQTESMFGSPAYMAPELFDSATAASPQSDLYAMGVVLYEMLAGAVPFVVDSMPSHVMRVSTQSPPSVRLLRPELSGDIDRAISTALAKDAAERFRSANLFAAALAGRGVDVSGEQVILALDADPARIGRDYRVDQRIGRGPTANVYRCTDESLGVTVAVKLLRGSDPKRRDRFLAEAKRQAGLHQGRPHRSIVAIRHIVAKDGLCALIEEHVDGLPLDRFVAEARPDLATVLRLFVVAADGLAFAHGNDLAHGNLKPSNVLVTWSGPEAATRKRPRVKLSDFGMQPVAGLSRTALARKTATEAFVAPELGDRDGATPASDVYALGALILLALLGRLPEQARGAQAYQALHAAVPQVSPELAQVLKRCLSAEPTLRPTAAELRDGLELALSQLTGEHARIEDHELALPVPPAPSRAPAIFAVVLALLAAISAGAWLALRGGEEAAPAAAASRPEPAPGPDTAEQPAPEVAPEPAYIDVSLPAGEVLAEKTAVISECLIECFQHERAAELTSAKGALHILLSVDGQGAVQEVEVKRDDLAIIGLGDCVAARAKTWQFPASGRPETYDKQYVF